MFWLTIPMAHRHRSGLTLYSLFVIKNMGLHPRSAWHRGFQTPYVEGAHHKCCEHVSGTKTAWHAMVHYSSNKCLVDLESLFEIHSPTASRSNFSYVLSWLPSAGARSASFCSWSSCSATFGWITCLRCSLCNRVLFFTSGFNSGPTKNFARNCDDIGSKRGPRC